MAKPKANLFLVKRTPSNEYYRKTVHKLNAPIETIF